MRLRVQRTEHGLRVTNEDVAHVLIAPYEVGGEPLSDDVVALMGFRAGRAEPYECIIGGDLVVTGAPPLLGAACCSAADHLIREREHADIVLCSDQDESYAGPVLPAGETGSGDVEVYAIAFCPFCGTNLRKETS